MTEMELRSIFVSNWKEFTHRKWMAFASWKLNQGRAIQQVDGDCDEFGAEAILEVLRMLSPEEERTYTDIYDEDEEG